VEGDGSAAMAYVDVTIGLPILAGALLADQDALEKRKRPRFTWKGDELESLEFE
jgi:hypothetical protein